MTSFEDHDLWYPDAQTNNIYITHNQSLILSYCKVHTCCARAACVVHVHLPAHLQRAEAEPWRAQEVLGWSSLFPNRLL